MPQAGCPCRCSFCSQPGITGRAYQPGCADVRAAVEHAHIPKGQGARVQLAFFGGSFTAIDREYMCALLKAGKQAVEENGLAGIRISTRPDKIDAQVLELLKAHGVTAIELGAQSMCEDVLWKNNRGHTAQAVVRAARLIRQQGFELGLQMMTGLDGDTPEKSLETAEKLIALSPDTIRIYPALVLRETELARRMEAGSYRPQTLEEAVTLCARLIPLFENAGIRVIRVGLHEDPSLRENLLSGPHHPAFRELCLSRIFLHRLVPQLHALAKRENLEKNREILYNISVSPKSLSVAVGQKKSNVAALLKQGFRVCFLPGANLKPGDLTIRPGAAKGEWYETEVLGATGV